VGLFNELASPFENEFKKASEDDIKKVCSKTLSSQSFYFFRIRNYVFKNANFGFIYCLLNYTSHQLPAADICCMERIQI